MKFDCGLTAADRLTEQWKSTQEVRKHNAQWHRVFAWFPIKIASHDCRWLEYVERRDKSLIRSDFTKDFFLKQFYREFDWEYRSL